MRILAFSDLHRDVEVAKELLKLSKMADVLVGAGDFATQGIGAAETLEILACSNVPVVLVHGNHDDPIEVSKLCDLHDQLVYLHGTGAVVWETEFFGLGGEIPPRNDSPWNAFETEERAAALLTACPDKAVLVTHSPPFGVADQQQTGKHEGSTVVRDAILQRRPSLLLCGHIHHAWGRHGRIASTHVHNLGPSANWFEI